MRSIVRCDASQSRDPCCRWAPAPQRIVSRCAASEAREFGYTAGFGSSAIAQAARSVLTSRHATVI
ncbi:hypothetical protein TM239_42980 [Bradyrhizobium sp. TM239]|nr:hypothetical protein TM239_42980 [Bradyrhizobium sp. TM239]